MRPSSAQGLLGMGFGFGVVPCGVGNWAQRSPLSEILCYSVTFGADLCCWGRKRSRARDGVGYGALGNRVWIRGGATWSWELGSAVLPIRSAAFFCDFWCCWGRKRIVKGDGRGGGHSAVPWLVRLEIRAQPYSLAKISPRCERWGAKQKAMSKSDFFPLQLLL